MKKLIALSYAACLCASLIAGAAVAAEQFSREVGKPLAAAQAEIKKKSWDMALARLNEANAVKTKTPYEQYSINEMKAYVYYQTGKFDEVAKLYEENLASGRTPPNQVDDRLKILTQVYARQRNDQKTIEYGNRWIKASGASNPDAYQFVAQAYYQQKDYRNAAKTMQEGINVATRNGKKIEENWLLLKLNSYYALKDNKGIIDTREQLVRSFPKPQYWENLLDMVAGSVEDDRAKLNLYRLRLDLNVLKKPVDYVEMAQMMMDKEFNVPAEAAAVVQHGIDNKVLENKDRERANRVLTAAKQRADAARQALPQEAQAAQAAATGEADVHLGAAYLSFGRNDEAIAAIERGIKKGVKNVDDARILLGRAYLKANRKDEARKAFQAVSNDSEQATIAGLWAIRAQQAS